MYLILGYSFRRTRHQLHKQNQLDHGTTFESVLRHTRPCFRCKYMVDFNFCKQLLVNDSFHGGNSITCVENDININRENLHQISSAIYYDVWDEEGNCRHAIRLVYYRENKWLSHAHMVWNSEYNLDDATSTTKERCFVLFRYFFLVRNCERESLICMHINTS